MCLAQVADERSVSRLPPATDRRHDHTGCLAPARPNHATPRHLLPLPFLCIHPGVVLTRFLSLLYPALLCYPWGWYPAAATDPFADSQEERRDQTKVHVRVQQRSGRKCITTVQGLADDLDLKRILKAFKKNFRCVVHATSSACRAMLLTLVARTCSIYAASFV